MIKVNINLEFVNRRELQRMIDLTLKLKCPMEKRDVKCDGCLYHDSCLKLVHICKRLEIAETYEK